MKNIINSNCKKCPDLSEQKCDGELSDCMCRFCPRNMGICIKMRWCRETESSINL